MDNDFQRAVRIQQRIKELATFSDSSHFTTRVYGTSTFKDCSNKIAYWMKEAKLDTRIDYIGNVRGKLKSNNQQAKTLVIGSHFDTMPTPMDSLTPVKCAPQSLQLVFKKNILCSSVAADGSDFSITGPSPVNIAGTTTNCINDVTKIITIN